ncbi:DUF2318 domain-containing protein [Dehalobacterium formicoaceticum]|uniref:DUF2318 domain-containing protein n=1 Tax=Dehalobacterium formicoaceticum TaxID=51515 RepID=A0ABT1Y4G4_9FIRM|nr:DUF2318 domain-containing protein [Dehalobacterium formicoaceticum]MCR6545772.1 DUF2318 domain-containing protein [Dehalobacterium formicoaceticum]
MGKNKNIVLAGVALIVIIIAVYTSVLPKDHQENYGAQPKTATMNAISEKGDLVIPVADITEKASFYAYNGQENQMEIIAVKASDGTIRTAFNTCQVCYSSGRGYYVQEGNMLVCQNCGNQFHMDDVQVTKGGCNPIPIDAEQKVVTDTSITITKDFLTQAEEIFANWKI